jgi:hypothetical protein
MGYKYEAKVTVDYYFDVEAESESQAEQWATYHFQDFPYMAEIYSIDLEEIGHDDECDCDECMEDEDEDLDTSTT